MYIKKKAEDCLSPVFFFACAIVRFLSINQRLCGCRAPMILRESTLLHQNGNSGSLYSDTRWQCSEAHAHCSASRLCGNTPPLCPFLRACTLNCRVCSSNPLRRSCVSSLPQTSSGTPGTLIIHTELDDRVDLLSKTSTSSLQATDLTLEIFKEGVSIEKLSPIGSASQEISLDPGVYNVQAYSAAFTAPAFEMPVYADEEQVTIQSESTTTIEMICTQSNAGIQIVYDEAFQQAHTDYSVSISQQGYTLEYKGLDATRTGYFLPGEVSLLWPSYPSIHPQDGPPDAGTPPLQGCRCR